MESPVVPIRAENTRLNTENQGSGSPMATGRTAADGAGGARLVAAAGERARRLAELAAFLPPADAALMRSVFADGKTAKHIGTLMGKAPRVVQRRIRRLVTRCLSPEFAYAALNSGAMDADLARVATLCVLHGRPVRSVAEELGLSQHLVRMRRASILAMARGAIQSARQERKAGTTGSRWKPSTPGEREGERRTSTGRWRDPGTTRDSS